MEININQTFEKAVKAHQNGKLEEAERLYYSILELQPEHLNANNNLGVILQNSGKLVEAEKYYKKAIEINPDFVQPYSNLGGVFIALNKFKEAEASCKKAIELEPNYADAYNNLANSLHKRNKLEEAIVCYQKAIELKPGYAPIYNNLGNTLNKVNRLEEAEINCKKAIELNPNYPEAYNNLGVTLHKLNKLDQAEKYYKKAIHINSYYAEAFNNLGTLLHGSGKLDEAEENFKKAIKLEPLFKEAINAKGSVLFDKGEFELALKDFDLCDTIDSRVRALSSLYALGKTKEIYQRIEKNSELDDENIKIASFSSFISHKEKKVTAHKFCNNPIDFISHSNLSTHLKNSNSFIDELIEELKNIKTRWEPNNKTTKNGFQSFDNLFEDPAGKLKALESIIIDELAAYYLKFKKEDCSYINKWPSKKNLVGWHVILKQQGYQDSHIHPAGWLSGVIYLKVVPKLEENEGAIEFSLNGKLYSDVNSLKAIHQPNVGDIVMFPSSLHHKTIPFTADEDRISIAFDLMPDAKY